MSATTKLQYMSKYIGIFTKIVLKRAGHEDYATRRLGAFDPLYEQAYAMTMKYAKNRDMGLTIAESVAIAKQG